MQTLHLGAPTDIFTSHHPPALQKSGVQSSICMASCGCVPATSPRRLRMGEEAQWEEPTWEPDEAHPCCVPCDRISSKEWVMGCGCSFWCLWAWAGSCINSMTAVRQLKPTGWSTGVQERPFHPHVKGNWLALKGSSHRAEKLTANWEGVCLESAPTAGGLANASLSTAKA